MEIVQYLRAVTRSWWLVLLALIAGGVGGYVVYSQATPQYRASAQVSVKLAATGLDPVSAASLAGAQAQSLALVAGTPPAVAAAQVYAKAPGPVSVSGSASASQPYVTITVTSTNPDLTYTVANAYVNTLADSAQQQTGASSTNTFRYTLFSVSQASRPLHPFSPIKRRDLEYGLAAGLVLGLALALLREALNNTVRNGDQLQRISELTVLGTVPRELPKKPLPASTDPRSARAEAYRQVRTALANATLHRPLVLAFTSAMLGEGKTSVVTNVATVLSRAGHRVAVVDADLRRPRVGPVYGIETGVPGLSEILVGAASVEPLLHHFDEGRLAVLAAGKIPQNPSEILGDVKMTHVLEWLAERYEFVLVDTPPVLPVADALVIAPMVQGVVMVSRLGYITRVRINHALAALDRVHATVIGVVANQAGKGDDSDYRYPYAYGPSTRRSNRRGAEDLRKAPPPRSTSGPEANGSGRHANEGDPFRPWPLAGDVPPPYAPAQEQPSQAPGQPGHPY